jgi:hypothetical protein
MLEQRVPALRALVARWRVASGIRCTQTRTELPRSLHRLHHRSCAPACRWRLQRSGEQALGRSLGGLGTKINVVVDAIVRLIQGRLSAGQFHDMTQARALLDSVPARCVVADAAAKAVIPPRANRRKAIQ